MIGRLLFTILLIVFVPAAYSQGPRHATPDQGVYDIIALKLKAGDTKIDFRALRVAYADSKEALAAGSSHLTRRAMNTALLNRQFDETIRIGLDILRTVYISPDTHAAVSSAYRELGDTQKAEFHKTIYLGLINSIITAGDGKAPETAYHVVTTEEEYALLRALGLSVWGQEIVNHGGRWYETLSATNTKTNQTMKVWFNIDIPRSVHTRTAVVKPSL